MKKNKLKQTSLILSGLLSSFLLSSCATVPPDVYACTEISMTRGYCIKTISDEEMEINEETKLNGKTWFEMRPYMIQLPIDSWAEIKKFVIKECKKNDNCNADISSWERKINRIDSKLDAKK